MGGFPAPVPDERSGLLVFLEQQRAGLRNAVSGLTHTAAVSAPSASEHSVLGLLKHAAHTERDWVDTMRGRRGDRHDAPSYADTFRVDTGEDAGGLIAFYQLVAAETESAVADEPDLGRPVPVPPGVPWFPDDVDAWSVRWVLLHLIEETARHAGHADIVRQSIDGATRLALSGASET